MSLWMPRKKPLYAPMLSSFGGGSVRGFNPGGGGSPFVPQNAISAFWFFGQTTSGPGYNNVRANLAAANTDLGFPSGSTFDVYGGANSTAQWEAATNNQYSFNGDAATFTGNYDSGSIGNGSGTNTYATAYGRYMYENAKGIGYHMFIAGAYQASTVFGSAGSQMPNATKIGLGTDYATANNVYAYQTSVEQPFLNNIGVTYSGVSAYAPQGGLVAANGGTTFGTGFDGGDFVAAKNGTASLGRVIASSHSTYFQSGDGWNSTDTSYASLSTGSQNMLKHAVQILYWLAGEMDDI
jgi:hypothetical protein